MPADAGTPLLSALNATDDDLTANRDGRLSERQRARLRRDRRRAALIGAGVLAALILLATALLFVGQRNGTAVLSYAGITATVVGAIYGSVVARNAFRLTSDIDAGAVAALTGTVRHTVRVAGRSATYVFSVDGHELVVPKPVFLAVKNGGRYRFYRTPNAHVLVSGEAL